MKIEILYPQVCCLYGDKANMMFLRQCLPEAEFITTTINNRPAFLDGDVDLVYLCSMSEQSQELLLSKLMPHKECICQLAKEGKALFLLVGNALELFGSYIQREDGSRVEALGAVPSYTVRQTPNRFNSLMKVAFEGMTLLGYTSRFSHTHGVEESFAFGRVEAGAGVDLESKAAGIYTGRLVGTYLLGPLLVANPDFTHWLLQQLGAPVEQLPFEQDLRQAYETKLADFDKPNLEMA